MTGDDDGRQHEQPEHTGSEQDGSDRPRDGVGEPAQGDGSSQPVRLDPGRGPTVGAAECGGSGPAESGGVTNLADSPVEQDATGCVETPGGVSVPEPDFELDVNKDWSTPIPLTPKGEELLSSAIAWYNSPVMRERRHDHAADCVQIDNEEQNLRAFADAEWRMRAGKRWFKREFERWQSRVTQYETVPEFWQRKSRA